MAWNGFAAISAGAATEEGKKAGAGAARTYRICPPAGPDLAVAAFRQKTQSFPALSCAPGWTCRPSSVTATVFISPSAAQISIRLVLPEIKAQAGDMPALTSARITSRKLKCRKCLFISIAGFSYTARGQCARRSLSLFVSFCLYLFNSPGFSKGGKPSPLFTRGPVLSLAKRRQRVLGSPPWFTILH